MSFDTTTPANALAHVFLAIMDASNALAHAAQAAADAEDVRRLSGLTGPEPITADLWHVLEAWRETMMDLEPFLPYIGAAASAAPMDADDADDAQHLANLSAPGPLLENAA